eukprot:ctg_4470.g614
MQRARHRHRWLHPKVLHLLFGRCPGSRRGVIAPRRTLALDLRQSAAGMGTGMRGLFGSALALPLAGHGGEEIKMRCVSQKAAEMAARNPTGIHAPGSLHGERARPEPVRAPTRSGATSPSVLPCH